VAQNLTQSKSGGEVGSRYDCRIYLHDPRGPPIDSAKFFFSILPLLVAVSIAASGYRFWLPFGKAKSYCSTILRDQNKLRNLGIKGKSEFRDLGIEESKLSIESAGCWISACISPVFTGISSI
jgi:hypothetical protein